MIPPKGARSLKVKRSQASDILSALLPHDWYALEWQPWGAELPIKKFPAERYR